MRLAYVTEYDAADVHNWSGIGFHMRRALEEAGIDTCPIGDLTGRYALPLLGKKVWYRLKAERYHSDRAPRLLRHHARQVEAALGEVDAIFSPGTLPTSAVKSDKPLIFWTDATFAGMVDFYPEFSHLCAETLRDGHAAEQQILTRCALAVYASDWAAASAIRHYDVDPAKVKVVPFGANLIHPKSRSEVAALLAQKQVDRCDLLFIGVDWARKGGDTALAVTDRLRARGIEAHLHIVGCVPPFTPPPYVTVHGFLSKRRPHDVARLEALMTTAHFLIVPSRAECFGIVFAEASAYGLPSLATDVGGIPSAIENGRNGQTFTLEASADAYVDFIIRTMASRGDYDALALRAHALFETRLNWGVAGRTMRGLIEGVVADAGTCAHLG